MKEIKKDLRESDIKYLQSVCLCVCVCKFLKKQLKRTEQILLI